MKKGKAILSILLAGMMVLGAAGCGGKEKSADDSTSKSTAESTDSGSSDGDTFKIGGIGPTTGGVAVYGQAVKNAAELAVAEINEAGGINGKQIELNFQDDEHDACLLYTSRCV